MSDPKQVYRYEGENEVQAAINAGLALGEPKPLDDSVYSVTVPEGATHHVVQRPLPHPERDTSPARARATYRPATVAALIDVVERHHDSDLTTVWVHPTNGQIVAVFNDHADGPGWRDHRAQLNLTATPEWMHWAGQDGRLQSQQAFAEHVEDGLAEIVEPPAADMLELAQTFHAKQGVNFRSATRLQSGEIQVQYDEKVDATAGRKGQMQIPQEFTLAIAPFLGEDPYKLTARLRYRIREGTLVIGYKLNHPERVLRDALAKIAEQLTEQFSAVFIGEPGS